MIGHLPFGGASPLSGVCVALLCFAQRDQFHDRIPDIRRQAVPACDNSRSATQSRHSSDSPWVHFSQSASE